MHDGVYDGAHVMGGHKAVYSDLAGLRIHLHLRYLGTEIGHILWLWQVLLNGDTQGTPGSGHELPQAELLAWVLVQPKPAVVKVHLVGLALEHMPCLGHKLNSKLAACLYQRVARDIGHPAGPSA